jgi:hypothetical protein
VVVVEFIAPLQAQQLVVQLVVEVAQAPLQQLQVPLTLVAAVVAAERHQDHLLPVVLEL